MSEKIWSRSEVPAEFTWKLEDLYASDDAWLEDLASLQKTVEELAPAYKGKLCESAQTLLSYLQKQDELDLRLSKLANYAMRKSDQDSTVAKYQDFVGKVMSFFVSINSLFAYATPELIAMEEETLAKFYEEKPELTLYKLSLDRVRRDKEHILSEKEEAIMAAAGQLKNAPDNIYGMFENADIKFPNAVDKDGKEYPLTNGSYIPLVQSEDRELRKSAFNNLYHTFEQFKNTLAALYDAEVKGRIFTAKMRKYPSTLEAALSRNEVPVSVYKNLISAVHENMHYMHKYMKLRKKLMGVDELHMYDIYTSIVPEADVKVTYDEAKANTLEATKILGEEYQSILKEGFANRWIDVYENVGKRSGAYSAGARPHPYVLLNHKDTLDSEFTLAHEMGHALHSYLSQKYQPAVYSDYVIFVAEVASTCNEALLMQYLLGKTTDKKQRAYLINYFLEQFRTTLYRQTMFAEFEMLTNEMAERGESLTADALCELYHKLNVEYYGDDIVIDREIDFEWERIPHFYYNFYVFQYATGFSAAIALSQRILSEGESAVKDYIKFLSGGSHTDPISLLKIAGVDMNSPEPVANALKLFGELIDEMDELLAE
ncbi:MAG: oligoendopeptidase F [Oscillospiraceae bacterium]|nr:oligoendopeptidase F [Oscillospiraceae bacterium]